jgi:hypothetical protein
VVLDSPVESGEIAFRSHEAIEIRFPTKDGQLYTITGCEQLDCPSAEQVFVLGDGAQMSHFTRASSGGRFYRVERY